MTYLLKVHSTISTFTTGIDNIYIRIAVFSLTVLFAMKGNFINTKKVPVVTLNLNLNGR